MGAEGARELAKANWPNLQQLGLGIQLIILERNNIGAEGARELVKANWPNLQKLGLRIQLIILDRNQIPPNAASTIFMNFRNQHSIKIKVYLWLLIKSIDLLIIDIQYHKHLLHSPGCSLEWHFHVLIFRLFFAYSSMTSEWIHIYSRFSLLPL